MTKLTNEKIESILEGGSNAVLVRHENTSRNKLLNQATCKLSGVVNNHDPEIDVPIKLGVWDCLDNVAAEIERPLHEEILSLRQEVERLREENDKLKSDYGDNWYDGFMAARNISRDRFSELESMNDTEILVLSENAKQIKAQAPKEQGHDNNS